MIKIEDKTKCSGCKACITICPSQCIGNFIDDEGFMYPKVSVEKCIDCGLCNKVCPVEQDFSRNDHNSVEYYGAYNIDTDIMKDSSSGGVFWLIVKNIISKGGVVYGAELKSNFSVIHSKADTIDECKKFRKSKYLQSDIGENYKLAKLDLENGKDVLFSGTPCQIAGLYTYLQKEYKNLITCDVVCHGVPSKLVFNKYIQEVSEKMEDNAVSMCWRDKRYGWGPNRVSIQFESGKELISTSQENPYQKGFLDNLYLRPICYECPFAKLPRNSDISLADFWGYEGKLNDGNKNKGLSLVIVSSIKGKQIFDEIKGECEIDQVSEDYAKKKSRHAHLPPKINKKRKKFFKDIKTYNFTDVLSKKYIYLSKTEKMTNKIKNVIKKIIKLRKQRT